MSEKHLSRGLLPEQEISRHVLFDSGLSVMALKKESNPEVDQLVNWLEVGCFDALGKQYLKTLFLGIYVEPAKPHELIESYEFNFSYPSKEQYCFTMHQHVVENGKLTRKEIMKQTALLVATLNSDPPSADPH
jgi:HORMA domain